MNVQHAKSRIVNVIIRIMYLKPRLHYPCIGKFTLTKILVLTPSVMENHWLDHYMNKHLFSKIL
jgi:hypothetical protein